MTADVVALTRALCDIPSLTGAEAAVVDAVAGLARARGLTVDRQRVPITSSTGAPAGADASGVGRDNLLITVGGRRPDVLLTTHLDTVPPFLPPTLEVKDGRERLVGRGVIDAKGIAAAMLVAHERLVAAGEERVGLLFVVGEETNSDGAKAAASGFAPRVRYFIDGEPTDGTLVSAMKGVLAFELEATGKAAHSAYPQAGHSALHQLLGDLHRLLDEPWHDDPELGKTTLNVGVVHGGTAPNVLAPHAQAICVLRTTKDADALEARVRTLVSPSTSVVVRTKSSPQRLHTVPGEPTCVVAFGSDVPHLSGLGRPLLIGPGSILDAHTSHEGVWLDDLRGAADHYQQLCRSLLAADDSDGAR